MSNQVFRYLARGRGAQLGVSALDAVMGEDWAIVEPGRARRGQMPRSGLRAAHAANVERGGSGGGGASYSGRKPQAVVKMVRNGGASDVRGLKAQMAYLSRDGAQPLQRSERMMGVEIDMDQAASIETGWRMPPEGSGRADRTSHFIASFPSDMAHDAAQRAGRAWAEEMFESGNFGGDSYDYYTAFHTDRAHPHMHVIVHRRGLDHGEWLKVSQRGDMNYDRMREVLVDVAAREGIELEATPRLARGLHDRPVPDAEYRAAGREGRAAVPPEHDRETAILAAASLIHYARRFAADALALERDLPEQSSILRSISERLAEGRAITIKDYGTLSLEQEKQMADRLEEVTVEVRGKFERLDGDVEGVEDNRTRMRLLRQIAELKENTVPYMREPGELAAFAERDTSGQFESFAASDPISIQVKTAADQVARTVAQDYGVDADATIERYAGPVPSRGLARQFNEAAARERDESRALSGAGPESVEERQAALEKMRDELQNVYREGREIVDERRAELAGRLEDRSFGEQDAEKLVRDGASEDQRQRDLEKMTDAKERTVEIVDSTPWRSVGEGREEIQSIAVKTDRGFHPGYLHVDDPLTDDIATRYSTVAVGTAEQAIALSDTFRETGDTGVRRAIVMRDRLESGQRDETLQTEAARPTPEDRMTQDQLRILRDLERESDDYDR